MVGPDAALLSLLLAIHDPRSQALCPCCSKHISLVVIQHQSDRLDRQGLAWNVCSKGSSRVHSVCNESMPAMDMFALPPSSRIRKLNSLHRQLGVPAYSGENPPLSHV